ncbi:hypothetical protein [uncultured Nostoc sp.]
MKNFSAALCTVVFLVQAFTPPELATNNDCTPEHSCRGTGRR